MATAPPVIDLSGLCNCCSSSSSSSSSSRSSGGGSSGPCTACGCQPGPGNTLHVSGSCSTTLTRSGNTWSGSCALLGCTLNICVTVCSTNGTCSCGDYGVSVRCQPCGGLPEAIACMVCTPSACSCSPFQLNFCCPGFNSSAGCCAGQNINITITEEPPCISKNYNVNSKDGSLIFGGATMTRASPY